MAEARRMGKSELFSHFADRFEVKRTQAREFFDELNVLAEKELKRSGEFVLPGMVKLVVQKRNAKCHGQKIEIGVIASHGNQKLQQEDERRCQHA